MSATGKAVLVILLLAVAHTAVWSASTILKSGDSVVIGVAGEQDLSRVYTIDDVGEVDFGLLGKTNIAGMTPEQAQLAVAEHLKRYIKDPQVRVLLAKAKGAQFTITGDVKNPGTVETTQELGVRDCLAFAGGALQTADLSQVSIVREGELIKVDLNRIMADPDPAADVKLKDGDLVNVPSRVVGTFTFLGAVNSVGTYPLLRGTKVLDALKIAGDVKPEHRVDTLRVVRDGESEIIVDLDALLQGKVQENVLLQPDDTVVAVSEQAAPASYSVVGGVLKPGRFDLTQKLTWTEAIAFSGGFSPDARQDKVMLVRRNSEGDYEKIPLDFQKILEEGMETEIYVQDGDTLNVPVKTPKKGPLEYLRDLGPLMWILL